MSLSHQFVQIESLDYSGQGVARNDEGKTIFIEGALPYEKVLYRSYRRKPTFENATTQQVIKESFMRTQPRCPQFGVCGGCSIQHVDATAQVAIKQRVLEDNLTRIGQVKPEQILPAIAGPTWGYRHRARLSARWVEKKGEVLVGFHEKRSRFILDMAQCQVLPPHISALLMPLRRLIKTLSIYERIPQIELAVGDNVDILVFRNMSALNDADIAQLKAFVDRHTQSRPLQIWLQPNGPSSCYPLYPTSAPPLTYTLPEFQIEMPYLPTEFTQVNPVTNAAMVRRALQLLQPHSGERIADMFCGIGNFTLPIARCGASVQGIDNNPTLVTRATHNAAHNALQHNTTYQTINLFDMTAESLAALGRFDKMLIDPPRDGAVALVKAISDATAPRRLVYVSCNPATLARDASILVHTKGYLLKAAGIINMFPHTAHVESIAWFEKPPSPLPIP